MQRPNDSLTQRALLWVTFIYVHVTVADRFLASRTCKHLEIICLHQVWFVISNFNITGADLYDLFGKYGPIRQIRLGTDANLKTKGTAYVVFESPDDAKEAVNQLNGFHLMERYIVGKYLSKAPDILSAPDRFTQYFTTIPQNNKRLRWPRRN